MSDEHKELLAAHAKNSEQTATKLFQVTVKGFLHGSATISRFSNWLLAVTGATAALFVSGMAELSQILTMGGIKVSGALLVLSGIFGLWSKLAALKVEAYQNRQLILHAEIPKIIEEHFEGAEATYKAAAEKGLSLDLDLDLDAIGGKVVDILPVYVRWYEKWHMARSKAKNLPYQSERSVLGSFYVQYFTSAAQSFCFVLFVTVAIGYAAI